MKKNIIVIATSFLLFACQSKPSEELLSIVINSPSKEWNGRNDKDYIKLWLNDSLIFSGTYFTEYNDTLPDRFVPPEKIKDLLGMTIAELNKKKQNYKDSLKVRLRLVTLDDLPDENPIVIDSTFFFHPIDSISSILFLVYPYEKEFCGYDYYHDPERWEVD